jgi:hypothetical protein
MTVHAINKVLSRKGAEVPSACKAAGPVPAKADKAAKPAKAEKPAKGNRRLQQYIGAGTASIIAMNNAKGAIQNAVDDANPAATFAATSAGQLNARATAFPTTRTFLYRWGARAGLGLCTRLALCARLGLAGQGPHPGLAPRLQAWAWGWGWHRFLAHTPALQRKGQFTWRPKPILQPPSPPRPRPPSPQLPNPVACTTSTA